MPDTTNRIALPVRFHDFLLTWAGRIDDDALTDARELIAVAELDRAVELLVGSLVAGRIPVTSAERDLLRGLVNEVRCAPALAERIIVDDGAQQPRHRFTVGSDGDPSPDTGVADALGRAFEVLPDIRSVSCVWRTTAAGAMAGPVPQQVVLVQTGPDGYAPSTAYRAEQALRRAGISAVVEVLRVGAELTDYHRAALNAARRVPVPVRPPETSTAASSSTAGSAAASTASGSAESSLGMAAESPSPRPVTSTRRRSAHAERRSAAAEAAAGRWQQRAGETAEPGPSRTDRRSADAQPAAPVAARGVPGPAPAAGKPDGGDKPAADPTPRAVGQTSATNMPPVARPPAPPAGLTTENSTGRSRPPKQDATAGVSASTPVEPKPEPRAAHAAPPVGQQPSIPNLQPVNNPANNGLPPRTAASSAMAGAAAAGDLSQREKELLRQLHEELAKREQSESPAAGQDGQGQGQGQNSKTNQKPVPPPSWQVDRSKGQRQNGFPSVDYTNGGWQHAAANADQTAVNGIPPYGGSTS